MIRVVGERQREAWRPRDAAGSRLKAMAPLWLWLWLWPCWGLALARQQPVFHNQFAVLVPAGARSADLIARRHGFDNLGQIGQLPGYFLFEHRHVHKRSLSPSQLHIDKLSSEPGVQWAQQQHEKVRKKRDVPRDPPAPPRPPRGEQPLDPAAFTDPLYKDQWYLNGGAKDGLDMNVRAAWAKGYTGKGVVVSILDDGIQTNHPDLAGNYDPLASTDINDNDDDPTPRDDGDNKHGTRCAGEVAAVASNGYCGVGVAYNSSIGGVRMLDGTVNDAVEARALGLNPDHVDIYSASWGPEDDGKTVDGPGPLARRSFVYGVTSGRKGRGSIFVWASGNGGRHADSCNCDGYTNSIFTLSISSATQNGYKPWYLEECSSTLATTYSSGTPGRDRSVVTADADARLRADQLCTADHTGTSASAPLAAGLVALLLEASPRLSWRDVQYLVVLTSRPAPLQREAGWALNGAGRKVSHMFGYGLMDAGAMVTLANIWTNLPPQHVCKSQLVSEDREIDARPGSTLALHVDADGCAGTAAEVRHLEHVQCRVSLRFSPRGSLRLVLTSPAGTASTLLFRRPRDTAGSGLDDWPFLSVHYWGERARGRWTLSVVNAGEQEASQPGLFKKWQLIFYGTAAAPVRLGAAGGGGQEAAENSTAAAEPAPSTWGGQLDAGRAVLLRGCDAECDAQGCYGAGPTQCVACRNYVLDSSCVGRCPPRSHAAADGTCLPCHESCDTCAGAGHDACLTCAPAHLRAADLGVCLQQCPDTYYEDYERGECVPCEPTCASCREAPGRCASCEQRLVLHGDTCLAACPAGTHETEDRRCAPCHESCETCSGGGEGRCVTCRPGRYLAADGGSSCARACPRGWRGDKRRRECVACPRGCATCGEDGACRACAEGWAADRRGGCRPRGEGRCSAGEYWGEGRCRPCHSTCAACDGPTQARCASCAGSLLLHGGSCVAGCPAGLHARGPACAACPRACAECSAPDNCTRCRPGLRLQGGACRQACAPGYHAEQGECARCHLTCLTCSGPRRDQCVRCPGGWRLAAGECRADCPEGFFRTDTSCHQCHRLCQACDGAGPGRCTACRAPSALQGGACLRCLASQHYDPASRRCHPCHASCRSCGGPGPGGCLACRPPLRLDAASGRCVPCCARAGPRPCCRCHPLTGECSVAQMADKRRKAAALDQDMSLERDAIPGGPWWGDHAFLSTGVVAVCVAATLLFGATFTLLQGHVPEGPANTSIPSAAASARSTHRCGQLQGHIPEGPAVDVGIPPPPPP
ncbi:furin-like protease 2 [Bacillus rossius redtenbacheri]|uniref:furin-like protease 2 n=1 Tax=Bacillus rossius redtenbacheri TaxID=93214 RepID=UPI002FDDEEE0